MNLDDVNKNINRHRRATRRGRGPGSTLGKTAGRGHKGQRSRAGFSMRPTFEGGQMPLVMRVAKRGFNNSFGKTVLALNVDRLCELFEEGAQVSPDTLREKRIFTSRYDELKILGRGEMSKKLQVAAHNFSETAVKKIEAAGGTVTRLPGKAPVPKNRYGSKKAKTQ